MGYYKLNTNKAGEIYFNLHAGNHEVILTSEAYSSRAAAENGIASVRTNSPLEERYDRKTSTNGQPYFALKAANGQNIGRSELYNSEPARDNGIESVKKNGPSTEVKDETAK